jgi:pimeloyl-ACP methyl ester carboxylesterase
VAAGDIIVRGDAREAQHDRARSARYGGSNALTCARSGDESESAYDLDRVRAETKACLDKVSAHADPRFYTTTMALRDLEALREALGKPRFNLVGVSYGTRVAQQYAKTYPDAVRSVILDSAVPNDNVLGSDFAGNLDAALKAQFAVCAADAKCAKAFGDPWANLEKLRAGLREKSVEVSYRDPVDNAQKTMRVGPETLAALARMYAYMPETGALLPLGIARAVAGDYAPLAGQAQMLGMQMKSLADNAMQLSVICSEDADRLAAREPTPARCSARSSSTCSRRNAASGRTARVRRTSTRRSRATSPCSSSAASSIPSRRRAMPKRS